MKIFKGTVVSVKMQKTASVLVVSQKTHPLYKKVFKRNKKFLVDTGDITVALGDKVRISENRHVSKRKNFKIIEVIK